MSRGAPPYMTHKPYLDKISTDVHVPHCPGGHDFNSVTNFPSLKHTGVKSAYEPIETPVVDGEGKLTMRYRVEALKTIKPILHADSNLRTKEVTFKRGHKQFLDKVLLDMESKKADQTERRMKHWNGAKSRLGFSGFSVLDDSAVNGLGDEPFNPDSQTQSPPKSREMSPSTKMVRFAGSTAGGSSAHGPQRRKPTANRIKLFEYLLDHTEPAVPAGGVRRYGSISMPCDDAP